MSKFTKKKKNKKKCVEELNSFPDIKKEEAEENVF